MKFDRAWKFPVRTVLSNIALSVVVCFAVAGHIGCETDVPDMDTEPPEVRLTITGPVIGRQEMSNPPTEEWAAPDGTQLFNLAHATEYSFILSVGDDGGVARANLRMPTELSIVSVTPAGVTQEAGGIERSLTLVGTESDARTGLVISGRFRTPDGPEVLSFEFKAEGSDFGGSSSTANQRFMNVNAAVQTLPE